MMDYKNINQIVAENIILLFDKKRIICLLRYGPKTKFDGIPPLDFDFLLLLNKYQNNDYLILSRFKKLGLPVEIFIDYKDSILSKGIKNYQRGRHGSYFFKILSSADTLLGKNFYKENEKQLDKNKINLDLLFRVEEYFYRIQKSVTNENIPNKKEIEKYLGRILTDLLLVENNLQFSDMHKYHYTDIIFNIINTTDIIDAKTKNLISKFLSKSNLDLNLLGEIINALYKKYLKINKNLKYGKH